MEGPVTVSPEDASAGRPVGDGADVQLSESRDTVESRVGRDNTQQGESVVSHEMGNASALAAHSQADHSEPLLVESDESRDTTAVAEDSSQSCQTPTIVMAELIETVITVEAQVGCTCCNLLRGEILFLWRLRQRNPSGHGRCCSNAVTACRYFSTSTSTAPLQYQKMKSA